MRSAPSSTLSGRSLLPVFLDLCRIVLSFQAICRIGIAAGRSDLKVRRSGGGFEPLPLTIGPDDSRAGLALATACSTLSVAKIG